MKTLMKTVAGTLALGLALTASAQERSVRIAIDTPYEPFGWQLPDGSLTGFEVELGNAVCAEMNLSCEWVIQAWDGIIPGLLSRRYDVIFSSMSITEERARSVLFSEPYYTTPSAWFAAEGTSINPANESTLQGQRVGVQRGTIQDNYITELFGDVVQVRRYATADDLVADLRGSRIDAIFLDFPVGEETILNHEGYTAVGERVTSPISIFGQGVGAAFRRNDTELANIFNEGLRRVKDNGTYTEIREKYFAYDIML
ncbi:MAG: transporter substrate-binding domain-containing protein [Natronospirillum sp.]